MIKTKINETVNSLDSLLNNFKTKLGFLAGTCAVAGHSTSQFISELHQGTYGLAIITGLLGMAMIANAVYLGKEVNEDYKNK